MKDVTKSFFGRHRLRFVPAVAVVLRATCLVCAVVAILASLSTLPVAGAPPSMGPQAAPSPRPPLSSGKDSQGDSDRRGSVDGIVTDYSTGRPGQGISVVVSGFQAVKTDDKGHFSVSGLAAGQYSVVVAPGAMGTPAQGAVYVLVDGRNSVSVNLGYYSGNTPVVAAVVATPASIVAEATQETESEKPAVLPESGSASHHTALTLVLGTTGLILLLAGIVVRPRPDAERK